LLLSTTATVQEMAMETMLLRTTAVAALAPDV
jgi:hypothetical protein